VKHHSHSCLSIITQATFSQCLARIPTLTLINPSATLEVNHLERQEIFRLGSPPGR
jgi:hypothetical protein